MSPVTIRGITLDLDDTLWPIWPSIQRAEAALDLFLRTHAPAVQARWPIERLRTLRDEIADAHPELAHDFTAQRRITLHHILELEPDAERLVDGAFEAFYAARNDVTLYADTLPALEWLGARYPLASLTNGNADLTRIGLDHHFTACIGAREVGFAKPHRAIFDVAAESLGLAHAEIAHVGDDPVMDVLGALEAGMFAVWLNRDGKAWPHADRPHLEVADLGALCTHLQSRAAQDVR